MTFPKTLDSAEYCVILFDPEISSPYMEYAHHLKNKNKLFVNFVANVNLTCNF